MKELDRIIELSSREVTGEEGIEHFNLKNKLESQLEKAEKWVKQKHLILSREEFDNHSKLIQENKSLKEDKIEGEIRRERLLFGKNEQINNLKEDLQRWKDNFQNCFSELDILKQKLEKIQKLVNDKDFLVTRRQLVDILKEKK